MYRYPYNVDRRPNVSPKPNKQPACVNCSHGFMFKDGTTPTGARSPLLLNCGHSVCESCIRTLLRNGDTSVTCKVCTKVSTLSSKVDSSDALRLEFPLNIYLVGQIVMRSNRSRVEDHVVSFKSNKMKASSSSNAASNNTYDELCCECSAVSARSLCRQCEVAYCDSCFSKVHSTAKSLQKHEKIPLVRKGQISGNFVFCKDHTGQKLEFFCKDCEVSTCAHCFICNHRNHNLITLKEKNAVIITDLAAAHEEASNVLKRLHFTQKKISNTGLNKLNDEVIAIEKAVSAHFTYLHGLLQLKENELFEEIRKVQTSTQQSLLDVSKELDSTIKELEEHLELGKAGLDPNNINSSGLVTTLSKLKDATQLPCHLVLSQDLDETTPYAFITEDITETLLGHCKIFVPGVKKWHLKSNDELPEDYCIEDIPSSQTAVRKTVPDVASMKPSPPPPLRKHHHSYPESELSSTSTDSHGENIHQPLLTKLKIGSVEQVTLCHLLSPGEFYVHRKSSSKDLIYYSQQFSKYAAVKTNSPETITVGTIYLVKFNADNKWYRGRVLDMLEDNKVEVYYIDYGNIEKTTIKNLRSMPNKYLSIAGMAIRCSLCDCIPVNGDWSTEAINIMANITSNVEVSMHIFRETPSNVYEVDLSRNDIGVLSLRDALIFLGLATLSDLSHRVPTLKKEFFLDQQTKTGNIFAGLVTTVNSPSDFYIQRLDENGKFLENLMDDMNKMYCRQITEKYLVYTPTLGLPVAAQFSLDDKWYRALVVSLPGDRQVEVFYVDYGNSEILMWEKLRFLHDKFLRMSCQALRCSLCDVLPKQTSEWPAEVTSWFRTYTEKKPLQVTVTEETKNNFKVVLYEQQPHSDVCVNGLLVKHGYANSNGENSTVADFPRNVTEPPTPKLISTSIPSQLMLPPETVLVKRKTSVKMGKRSKRSERSESASVKSKHSEISSDTTSYDKTSTNGDGPEDLFRIPITILNVVSPALFYVSISSQEKQIKKLGTQMAEFYSNITTHNATWAVDSKCAVMRKSDKKWYRGVIIEIISDNQVKILLKDIATVELCDTSNLMPLDDKFLAIRDGGIKCHLSGITAPGGQDVWPGVATEVFIEELDKYPQKYMSKMGEILNDSLPVELFVKSVTVGGALEPTVVDWKTINQILVSRGFALPVRNKGSQVVTTSELLKELEDRPSSSMEELVTNWLNKTQQESCPLPPYNLSPFIQSSPNLPASPIPRRPRIPGIVDRIQAKPLNNISKQCSPVLVHPKINELRTKHSQDVLKSFVLPSKSQNDPEAYKVSTSGSSSPNLKTSVKSLDFPSQTPTISVPQPFSDMNSITEWLPAVPFKSLNFAGCPTFVDNECNIYIQDSSQSKDTLEVIHSALTSRYKNTKPMPHDLFWFPGMICIARYFNDKSWYRAKVLKVNDDNTVDVQFVDYGNIENCKASELRKNICMGHIPIQCHSCSTPGIIPISSDGKWPIATLDFIHGTIVDKTCHIELKEPDSPTDTYVLLSLKCPGELDLMELLLSMHYATYFIDCEQVVQESSQEVEAQSVVLKEKNNSPNMTPADWYNIVIQEEVRKRNVQDTQDSYLNGLPQNPKFQSSSMNQSPIQGLYNICEDLSKIITEGNGGLTYIPAVLPKSDECLIEVTGVLSALDFVVQLFYSNEDENLRQVIDEFETLTEEMQVEAENQPPLVKAYLGGACCAHYTLDNTWYRASILEDMGDGKIKVQYVDFGNVEILPLDRIRSLKEEWAKLPLQGIKVHLWGVHKPRNFNAEKTGKMLVECMLSGNSPFTMKIQSRIGTLSVQIFNKSGQLAYQPLLDEKLLLSTLP